MNDTKQLNCNLKIIDFIQWNKVSFIILEILTIISIIIIILSNFNWSIDFTGGSLIEIQVHKPINIKLLRDNLIKNGFSKITVQHFGSSQNLLIKTKLLSISIRKQLLDQIKLIINKQKKQKIQISRIESVGPSISLDFIQNSIFALLLSIVILFIYIGFRFKWNIACGLIIALIHDLIITCGFLSFYNIEIDSTIIASLMSIIGYSLNDKIIISDRVRENCNQYINFPIRDIINISLTQTLQRTLMTSFTSLVIVLILCIFGGNVLKGFSLTMLVGIIIGTISSIYVSLPIAFKIHTYKNIYY
ncbi:MAG: protein translocase subunit SecF [Pantoea sp. Brub]|nr:protein translocase subunit SecF [Pantoea sp. Brub]